MEKKMSRSKALGVVINGEEITPEVIEVLTSLKASLDKKTEKKVNPENENIKSIILDTLSNATEPMTVTGIQNANADLKALSNQKVSSLVRQLVLAEVVKKSVKGKMSIFTIA